MAHNYYIIFFAVAIIASAFFSKTTYNHRKGAFQAPTYYPYKKRHLLTKQEYPFYMQLKQACDSNNLIICPKVRLEDICYVTEQHNVQKFRGYINSKHVDFLICDSKMNMLAAIELDDASHNGFEAKKIDSFKDNLFDTIGIPLYRIKTKKDKDYSKELNIFLKRIA